MIECPRFAVVGHPNKGKSSIVSTLTHCDSVAISELSGTTTASQSYSYRIEGEELYTLFDTPGFQRPRQALDWIEHYASDASQRLAAVEAFVQENRSVSPSRFSDEVQLLQPIINEQAGVIYVVDGSVPYSPEYEAEMTILQWTGQPRMALINPIGGEQYVEQWQRALGQYFSVVKIFNPMTADTEKQLSVLSAFAELNPSWKHTLEQAAKKIREHQTKVKQQAAYLIAEALSDLISHQEALPLLSDATKKTTEAAVKTKYQTALTVREGTLRRQLTELYSHQRLSIKNTDLNADYPDIFDQNYWFLFGLSRKKLVALSASAGALAGAAVDAGVGGASLMTGALLGGLVSGSASLYLTHQPDKVAVKGIPLGGKQLTAGPVKNLQFAFVLLGRAVDYQRAVASRAHADRRTVELDDNNTEHWIDSLDKSEQVRLTRLLQKGAKGLSPKELNAGRDLILKLL